jgi:hypothetical protein
MKGSTPGGVVTSFDVSDGKHHHHNHHQQQQERSTMSKWCHRLWEIYEEYELLVLFVVAIVLAKAYPNSGPNTSHHTLPQRGWQWSSSFVSHTHS